MLRTVTYSNTSQIITVFSRERGILSLLARGSLRPARRSSSFPAPFDLAGWYDIAYLRRSGELQLATESRLVEGFDRLRRSLTSYREACFALDVVRRMFRPDDPHPEFLRGALSHLKLLGVGEGELLLRIHFVSSLLRETGLSPSWSRCVESGAELATPRHFRVPVGVVGEADRHAADRAIDPRAAAYLAGEGGIPWGQIPSLEVPREVARRAWSLLREVLIYHLETVPLALAQLEESPSARPAPPAGGRTGRGSAARGGEL